MDRKPVGIMDTTLRDGQQSLIATRMSTDDMLPILEKMDSAGFHAMEVWGGATFDSCLRFLREDPWERLRKIRKSCRNTKLQMLLRGQNLIGYKMYPDDVVERFIEKSVENGIDIIRVFDALNDIRNLETSVKAIKKANAHAQLAISYTLDAGFSLDQDNPNGNAEPVASVYTLEYFVRLVKEFESMGADSICIKDMAGLLLPERAYELVKAIKETTKLPLQVHCHYTSGIASMTYLKSVEAGADIVDTAISPFATGTSQPATEVIVAALKGTPYDTGLNVKFLGEIAAYFRTIRDRAVNDGLLDTKMLEVDINTLIYQVPGGMLSNLVSQLKLQNAQDKYYDVLKEIPMVRKDLGAVPLVTPTSQIVGTQAVMNVVSGERYKMAPKETKDVVRGKYGKTPVKISEDIRKKIIGDEEPIACRPADLLEPGLESAREAAADYIEQDEDVLSYALFPMVAVDFFKYRQAQKYKVDPNLARVEDKVYPV